MDRREAQALDRWLTTDPRDTGEECPEPEHICDCDEDPRSRLTCEVHG